MTRKPGARIYRGTSRNLAMLSRALQQGELVAVPTETVYGLAANAMDPAACRKIFKAKGRPTTDPLIVHIHEFGQLEQIARSNPAATKLAKAYWPGPLTLILPKRSNVPSLVTASLDTVAVRMPSHPLMRRLLKTCGLPLAAPSANPFGYVSPTTAQHVRDNLSQKIRYILDGGPASIGLESTIVDARDEKKIRILRPGAITAGHLSRTLCRPVHDFRPAKSAGTGAQRAPGLLKQHYSPKAKVCLHKKLSARIRQQAAPDVACLFFSKPPGASSDHVYWLDQKSDLTKAGRHLFGKLRDLDRKGYRTIHAEMAPAGPLADAINDRLRRAAAK